jgi:hypothetical protein
MYASLDEETAGREVTARKARLGGRAQISAYPRFTYLIAVEIDRCTDFRSVKPSSPLSPALAAALDEFDLQVSQQLGQHLMTKGVQGAIVPSLVGPNANVVAFLDAEPPPRVQITNRDAILKAIEGWGRRSRKFN